MMQPRFDKRTSGSVFSLVEHLRFRAGYDFLRLRSETGEVPVALADWWLEFSEADQAGREDLVRQAREELKPAAKLVKVVKARTPAPEPAKQADAHEDSAADPAAEPAKKRRRRKRKSSDETAVVGDSLPDSGTPS